MSQDDSEYDKYVKDSRIPCKYGTKCYQKNSIHHDKYKHPPQKHNVRKARQRVTPNKRPKLDNTEEKCKLAASTHGPKVRNDVSSSDTSEQDDLSDNSSDCNSKETVELNTTPTEAANDALVEKDVVQSNTDKTNTSPGTAWSKQKEFIKDKFLVEMPKDFYDFWNFCKKLKPENPFDALKSVGLTLVGPYDVLAGRFNDVSKPDGEYLIHWRYFRDPPEFQTVLKGDDRSGFHIGYFRDSPEELPVLLASNECEKSGVFNVMGGNIFAAVRFYIEELKKTGDPFKKMSAKKVEPHLLKEAEQLMIDMNKKTKSIVAREKKIVTRTLNKLGLVVPYDRKTQLGYRELAMNNKELTTLLDKLQNSSDELREKYLSELQPVLTYASIATDECDFGTGIELGWDIISHGIDSLNSTVSRFLVTNYKLLNRDAFAKIADAHMNNRRKGYKLSVL